VIYFFLFLSAFSKIVFQIGQPQGSFASEGGDQAFHFLGKC